MSIKVRLKKLEKTAGEAAGTEPPWSPPEVYARLRREAQAKIDSDLAIGEEPLYWIDDAGIIRASDDGSFVRHLGDYIQAIDREMRMLDREIDEEQAHMSPEEIRRAGAEHEEYWASLDGLSLDEKIQALEAEIAMIEAEEEGEG